MYAGGDMDMIADAVVMIHSAAGIQNDVSPDHADRIDHDTGTDHASRANLHIRSNDCTGVTSNDKALALSLPRFKQPLACCITANRNNDTIMRNIG